MSICPKGKISKKRRDEKRAASFRIAMPNLTLCPKCGEYMQPHRACRACGTYNKREVLNIAQ